AVALAAVAGAAHGQFDFRLLLSVDSLTPGEPGQVLIVGSDGEPAGTFLPDLATPRGTALAADGAFFVSVTGGLGSTGGVVVKVDPDGTASDFVTDVSPFDLEVDPQSGDLFISDAAAGILRVPLSGPDAGVPQTGPNSATPGVFVDTFQLPDGSPGGPLVPSGLGFAPSGDLFSGLQATDPTTPGTAGLLQVDLDSGVATQVGVLDTPFDVQVDSQGNVFANNVVPGGAVGESDGEIAVFPGLGAPGATLPAAPIESDVFSPTAIRGLAIGPVGTTLEDAVFASTGDLTIVQFDPFDPATFDPTFAGTVFADDVEDPFAFDIQIVIPEPAGVVIALVGCVAAGSIGRGRRAC
ncbi:MAG: hypothetical protein AAF907_05730, partial [Planctomycetota bacterium]